MKTQSLLLFTAFSSCLVGETVDAVRPFYKRQPYMTSARFEISPRKPGIRFQPTNTKCCKTGERTARKRMSCNIGLHAVSKRFNSVHKAKLRLHGPGRRKTYGKALAVKISKCSVRFSKNFEKCCNYRAQFMKELLLCRQRIRKERKSCRAMVRRRYP